MTQPLRTTGDARLIILETISALRAGTMPAATGLAIAANMKVLNDSMQTEINAAKLSLQAKAVGADFGALVPMGQRLISGETVVPRLAGTGGQ